MTAKSLDLKIEQGADFDLVITVLDSVGETFDLELFDGEMQLRRVPGGELIDVSVDIDIDDQAGTVSINIPYTETALLTFGTARYDVIIHDGQTAHRLLEGNVSLSRQITVLEV